MATTKRVVHNHPWVLQGVPLVAMFGMSGLPWKNPWPQLGAPMVQCKSMPRYTLAGPGYPRYLGPPRFWAPQAFPGLFEPFKKSPRVK